MSAPTTADPVKEPTSYMVSEFINPKELKNDLAFSQNDLSDAMMQQASLFAHYGVLLSQASRQVDVVELLLENTEAAVQQMIRNELATEGTKATETAIAARVSRHPRVISMKKALNEAKRIEALGKSAVEAFRHRRDMLVQLGLLQREELKGDLAIRAKSAREDAAQIAKDNVLARLSNNSTASE